MSIALRRKLDRGGARVLRDPSSANPYVLFYATKRVGGGVQHFDAISLQPRTSRACRGRREGGQWTDQENSGRNDPRILSDATSDNDWKPGAQYAQARGGRRGGAGDGMGPGQAARLAVAEARAQDAIRRVREIDPTWRPTPSLRTTPEGEIATAEAEAREAEARFQEFARNGIGPGPYAGESIPARGPSRSLNSSERQKNYENGEKMGMSYMRDE
jgi:hypothetical protein